jgi:uncharacterized protein (DUF1697 family)
MPIYIALLRGINIGPHKRMKMEKLVACCAACGFAGAKTYIQSGNIVLKAPKMAGEKLSKKLEAQIGADFGFSADVIPRTKDELGSIIKNNPLLKEPGIASEKLHVVFLSQPAPSEAIDKLQSVVLPPDRAVVAKKEIYFYFPNGVSGSSLWKHPLDKVLKVSATMRNWNTVNKLFEMAEGFE